MLLTMPTAVLLRSLAFSAALAGALLGSGRAWAQFEFEDEPTADAEAPAAAVADEPAPIDAAIDAAALVDFGRRDPVVAAVLELPRETPAQQLGAILALIDLRRTDVAALLTPALVSAEMDEAQRADLVRQFGSARFLQLIRLDAPRPGETAPSDLAGLGAWAQAALDAAAAQARDPQRIAAIVQQLNAPAEEDRYAARVDLRATGEAGIVAAMHALATAPTAEARANIATALGEMRPTVDAPLIAVITEGAGPAQAEAARLAGYLRIRAALPWLAALSVSTADPAAAEAAAAGIAAMGLPRPGLAEVQGLLRRELAALDAAPLPGADEPRDAWWSWSPASNQLTATLFTPRQMRALERARLTRALALAAGHGRPDDRRMGLIDALEEAGLLGRDLSPEAAQTLAAAAPGELSVALAESVAHDRLAAAVRLATELGARGDATVLSTPDGRPSPLAAALKSPVRELRFAALKAVMTLAPARTFPGASFVPKALWYFAAGAGDPSAVAAAPIMPVASDWAGQLRGLGYEAMPAATGRAAIVAAVDPGVSPRLALIVLDSDIGQPRAREVVYQLHNAAPTASVPILLAASPEDFAAAQALAAQDPLVLAAPRPDNPAALGASVEDALALSPSEMPPRELRTEQARQSLEWLAGMLDRGGPYDELRRDGALVNRTLYMPELADPSLRLLAVLGTAESQTSLIDYASALALPIESRRAAAAALAASFQRYGIQLTSAQILTQYDRYNAAETADAATQTLMGHILDLLEKKP